MHEGQARVRYLDGLRGIAILIVMGWHFVGPTYSRFLPYGSSLAWLPGFGRGWIGVQLFFLISGYVIFLTLERCRSFWDFMLRRWLRLFPAMLAVSILVFMLSQVGGQYMPDGQAQPIDLLPGLTFVDPSFYHALLHRPIRSLDGVFWTLYIEAAFYVVIGLLYFPLGWQRALMLLVLIWAAVLALPAVLVGFAPRFLSRAAEPFYWAGFQHFGWFASGALFLKARETGSQRLFGSAITLGIASALSFRSGVPIDLVSRICLVGCVALFAAAQRWAALQRLLEATPLLFVGGISYALYLCHTQIGIAALQLLSGGEANQLAYIALPTSVALIICLAWFITRVAEPGIAHGIKPFLSPKRN